MIIKAIPYIIWYGIIGLICLVIPSVGQIMLVATLALQFIFWIFGIKDSDIPADGLF